MGFIDKIFRRNKTQLNINKQTASNTKQNPFEDENVTKLLELKKLMDSLLGSQKYVARSDYMEQMKGYSSIINFFDVLEKSGMLSEISTRNGVSVSEIEQVIGAYANMEEFVEQHNEKYISETMVREKEYLDNVLKSVDPVVSLDEDQRRVVLT